MLPGRDRGEAAAARARARARPLLPPTPEVCNGNDSCPGSPGHPALCEDLKTCSRTKGVSHRRRAPCIFPGRPGGRGTSGLEGHTISWGLLRAPDLPGAPEGAFAPRRPFALCKELQFLGPLPRSPSGVHGGTPAPQRGSAGPIPAETDFNKFGQEVLEPPLLGLARQLRMGPVGSELCSAWPARAAGRRAPSIRLRPEPGSPWARRIGVEAPGLECVIREQAPRPAGRVSKSAPLLCPSLALPPPLSLRHPLPQPPGPPIPAAVA